MADQYVEAAGEERFDAAVALTLRQWSESQSLPFEQVATEAVHEVFCGCVGHTYTEDEINAVRDVVGIEEGVVSGC
jgi:hypothetical protein